MFELILLCPLSMRQFVLKTFLHRLFIIFKISQLKNLLKTTQFSCQKSPVFAELRSTALKNCIYSPVMIDYLGRKKHNRPPNLRKCSAIIYIVDFRNFYSICYPLGLYSIRLPKKVIEFSRKWAGARNRIEQEKCSSQAPFSRKCLAQALFLPAKTAI